MKLRIFWLRTSRPVSTQKRLRYLPAYRNVRFRSTITSFFGYTRTKSMFAVVLSCIMVLVFIGAAHGQSPQVTCRANYLNGVLTGDVCDLAISPAPAAGSVVIYWVSGTLDPISGNVVPWALPLDFHGWTTLEYSGPTVGSITYNEATIYTRPLP